jgi:hypothetical protein
MNLRCENYYYYYLIKLKWGFTRNLLRNYHFFLYSAIKCIYMNQCKFLADWFLSRMIFGPEDEGNKFLRNVGSHKDCTALYPRRW